MKHQHAEQIHAFADGKAIQCRKRTTANNAPWEDIGKPGYPSPSWFPDFEYRVKPEPLATWMDKTMLKKVGELTKANDDLRHELSEKEAEINQLNGIIKCIDNSSIKLSKESREYRQANADLYKEIEHLKQQNEHLQWAHDTAQACRARTQEQLDALREAEESADTDAQVFGADVIISIQFPPQEKL